MSGKNNFQKKIPGKLDMFFGVIVGVGLFLAYRIGINIGAVWSYLLLLVLSLIVLFFLTKNEGSFKKICAIVGIMYAVFCLIQPDFIVNWLAGLEQRQQKWAAIVLFVFAFAGKLIAVAFSIFVIFFGFLVGAMGRWILQEIYHGRKEYVKAKKRRKLPGVQSIVRRDKRVYLYEDYDNKQTHLIFRQGRKKKILDVYQWEEDESTYYALDWDEKKIVTVHQYTGRNYKKISHKIYKL